MEQGNEHYLQYARVLIIFEMTEHLLPISFLPSKTTHPTVPFKMNHHTRGFDIWQTFTTPHGTLTAPPADGYHQGQPTKQEAHHAK